MKEANIYAMQEANARRSMLLLRQFEFLETRIAAYETLLMSPWNTIRAIFSPQWRKEQIGKYQAALLESRAQQLKAAAEKRAENKPRLVQPNGVH